MIASSGERFDLINFEVHHQPGSRDLIVGACPLSKWSPSGIASVRCVVVLSTATEIVLDALDMSPKQPADTAKCVAYDEQHDGLTMPGAERSCAFKRRQRSRDANRRGPCARAASSGGASQR